MGAGPRGVTSIDVARAAGVSQATVSRVLNDRGNVSAELRELVEAAIERLGYRPNLSARSLVTNRTRSVGVVLGDLGNSYYAELLTTISAGVAREGHCTLILSDRAGTGRDLADLLWEASVDGVIVTTSLLSEEDERRVESLDVPAVTMTARPVAGADSISPDNRAGGRLAARHLLDLGHRRIAVLTGPLTAVSVRDRHDGFTAELAADGVDLDPALVRPADLDYALARAAASSLLAAPTPPTAVFCHNDLMAFATLNAAAAAGLRVPDDVSVLGFDDVAMSSWESFRLTTVRAPLAELADGAVGLLFQRLADPATEAAHVVLPCTLEERATTRALG